ncbi:MAG: OsmC family protein [Mariprofundaceae bacterium]
MQLELSHEDGVRFTAHCRTHHFTIDQPTGAGGTDAGPTPLELFATSVASCVGYYVVRFLEQAGLPDKKVTIGCDWTISKDMPKRIATVRLHLRIPDLPENRQAAIRRVAERCLIHQTLKQGPELTLVVETLE